MSATLLAPPPAPPVPDNGDTFNVPLDELSPIGLVHEMERAFEQDLEYSDRFYAAASRLKRWLRTLEPKAAPAPEYPLFAEQHVKPAHVLWRISEIGGLYQVEKRETAGTNPKWEPEGKPYAARDREEAAWLAGYTYGGRFRIAWTSTEDGRAAGRGDAARRREMVQ